MHKKKCQHVEQTYAKGHGATRLLVRRCCCATLFELLKEAYECVTLFKMHGVTVRDFFHRVQVFDETSGVHR